MVLTVSNKALPPKLTRACKACIRVKRKCSFDLPKCSRCRKREIDCAYVNQPLTVQKADPTQQHDVEAGLDTSLRSYHEVHHPGPSLACARLDDPIAMLTVNGRTISFLNNHLREEVASFSQTGTTTFIHAKTPPSALLTEVHRLISTIGCDAALDNTLHLDAIPRDHVYLLTSTLTTLIAALPTLHSYTNLLPFTQSIILIQILTFFMIPPHLLPPWIRQTSDARRRLLKRSTRQLWQTAPSSIPSTLSNHEAYALAESTRRTIIMAMEVEAQCSMHDRGFFELSLFGVSLPFDRRFGLWGAESAAFDEAMERLGDGYGAQHMVSYREFCDMFDRREIETVERPFEIMMLVGAKGLDQVEERYGLV